MADIATVWDAANARGDWLLPVAAFAFARDAAGNLIIGADGRAVPLDPRAGEPADGLTAGGDIATAVLISIFTDAAAEPDDGQEGDPRGWWGDPTIGSRLWLRHRAKQTPATLLLARADIEAACAWLIADGVAAAVDVTTEWTRPGVLGAQVIVRRTAGPDVAVGFEWAWRDL